jgi:ADP-heptose:LPS heptosyltransferase
VKRFALIRTDRIGDLVLSLPVAEAIKEALPASFVAFIVSPYNAAIAKACPFVDDVIEYDEKTDRPGGLVRLTRSLRRGAFDAALFLRPTLRAALAAALAGVPVRVGTAYRFYSLLFTRRVPEHRKHAEKHESEFNMALLASVLDPPRTGYRPRIEIGAASRLFAERLIGELGLDRRNFAIVHPGSGGSARNFTPGGYAWLADYIEDDLGVKVVFTSGPGEGPLIEKIDSLRGGESTKVHGPVNLMELAAFIENAALFISGSTGPMHIAAAVGTPTLSFFSPVKSTSPRRWGPLTDKSRVIMPPVPECPTCIGVSCEYYDCMDRIHKPAVMEAARALLK